jgi:hypothetical protein
MTISGEAARMTLVPHEHQREVREAHQATASGPRRGAEALASQSHGHGFRLNRGRIPGS